MAFFCNVVSPGSLFEAKGERERVKGKHGRWVGHCVATEGRNLHLCVSDMVLFFFLVVLLIDSQGGFLWSFFAGWIELFPIPKSLHVSMGLIRMVSLLQAKCGEKGQGPLGGLR